MNECLFCKIVKKEIPADIVYEDNDFLSILNISSLHLGQTLLMSKSHYENLHELPDNILTGLATLLKKISISVKKTTNADGINIIMNIGGAAGQIVPHAHFHIIPRFADDGYKHWPGKSFPKEEMTKIAEKIKKELA